MRYEIIYKNEVIDTAEDLQEANYLVTEYQMAYHGGITKRKTHD